MDDFRRCHVPAFGSWNVSDDLSFSECFEPEAKQVGFVPYHYYNDRDLYVAGDLYGYDVITPAVIVVPRRRTKQRYPHAKEVKKGDEKEAISPDSTLSPLSSPPPMKKAYKPVDEDLYKISPDLLFAKPKRKRGWGIFSSCFMPICSA